MILILGAGLSGLSCSYYLGHGHCTLLEAKSHPFGHIHSELREGFTWDEGPHVSFTKSEHVKKLFAESVQDAYDEYAVTTRNYYKGHWIDHPAQSNLYQIPEPLRSQCLDSFLSSRREHPSVLPRNYGEWLDQAFGPKFAKTFPSVYTRKYWTAEPSLLTTDWVGKRVFQPKVEEVVTGAQGPLDRQTHYITHVRYPRRGGYQSFGRKLAQGARIQLNEEVASIDLARKQVTCFSGRSYSYTRLVNTLPLPLFVEKCIQTTAEAREAARCLSCTRLLLVNATAPHPTQIEGNWFYVYDEDKYSTRINCTEKLTAGNAPDGQTGVQVEVYFSGYKPQTEPDNAIGAKVVEELIEMGFLKPEALAGGRKEIRHFIRSVPWANVLFDHSRREAVDALWNWLQPWGLAREEDDLEPMTDWNKAAPLSGFLAMAGRFAQWKYFWTDDCVLRGSQFQS